MKNENAECYISVDIEAAGPIPGDYSMLSIGACLVADTAQTFYVELQPISTNAVPEAVAIAGMSLDTLTKTGTPPREAMEAFAQWIERACDGRKPVFVGFNGSFDWSFVNWYFQHFVGSNPLGIGGIDIKSFFMGVAGVAWSETRSSRLPDRYRPSGSPQHSHNALDDAVEQASIFAAMLADAGGNPSR